MPCYVTGLKDHVLVTLSSCSVYICSCHMHRHSVIILTPQESMLSDSGIENSGIDISTNISIFWDNCSVKVSFGGNNLVIATWL